MNEDQIKGKWDQIKGRAKKAWAELTDDDFKKAEGSVDKLHGIIQEKVGDTKESIKAKLGDTGDAIKATVDATKTAIEKTVDKAL